MRVLIVTPMFPPDQAGIALQSAMLADGLLDAGHDAAVLAYSPRDVAAPGADAGHVHRVPREVRRRRFSPSLWWRLRRLAGRADVIHVHGYTNLNLHAWLARRGKPVVATYHGTEVWHYEPRKGGALFRHLSRRAKRVCVSLPLADALRDKAGLDSAVVEPAIGRAYVAAAQACAQPDDAGSRAVLSVKGLYPVNDQTPLLQAMARILQQLPDVELWLGGIGPLQPQLEALAEQLGISASVKFLGLLDNEALVDTYAEAAVFANTATLESYGNVTVEALACGTPVVACETAGARALAREFPRDIHLVPCDDVDALARALHERLARPRVVSCETRTRIAEEKCPETMVRKYLQLYGEISDA